MPLLDRLKQLQEEKAIVPGINESLRQGANQTRETLLSEMRTLLPQLIKEAVGGIRVRDGQDGKDGSPGRAGKDARIDIKELKEKLGLGKNLKIDDIKDLRNLVDNLSQRISRAGGRQISGSGAGAEIVAEVPSGLINGSNTTYTLSRDPRAGTVKVFFNGQRLHIGTGFTIAGRTITMDSAPATNSSLICDYENQ